MKATAFEEVKQRIAKSYGMTAEELAKKSPEDIREINEKRSGKKIKFVSEFPTIGRGNVLRDCIVTSEEINADIDKALGV